MGSPLTCPVPRSQSLDARVRCTKYLATVCHRVQPRGGGLAADGSTGDRRVSPPQRVGRQSVRVQRGFSLGSV